MTQLTTDLFKQLSRFFPVLLSGFLLISLAHASEKVDPKKSDLKTNEKTELFRQIRQEISKNFGSVQVEVSGPIRWSNGSQPHHPKFAQYLGDDGRGNAHFLVQSGGAPARGQGQFAEGWIHFSAKMQARVAVRRVRPGEPLANDSFVIQTIDVALGRAYDYRGVVLPIETRVSRLEATQTILEGQLLVSTSVRQIPDVQRGDALQIQLISNGVNLSVPGIAEEPGYFNKQIRVMAGKQKRELKGVLMPGGTVEVNI